MVDPGRSPSFDGEETLRRQGGVLVCLRCTYSCKALPTLCTRV